MSNNFSESTRPRLDCVFVTALVTRISRRNRMSYALQYIRGPWAKQFGPRYKGQLDLE